MAAEHDLSGLDGWETPLLSCCYEHRSSIDGAGGHADD